MTIVWPACAPETLVSRASRSLRCRATWPPSGIARRARPCSYGAEPGDAADLLSRIDVVPPSLALAQAAQESGWGTSRFARNANALYGQRSWGSDADGLKPAKAKRQDFRVRAFPDLLSAVRSYMHNLNSHRAYAELRQRRAQARALGAPLNALDLVGGLKSYSEEGKAYVRALSALIEGNELQSLDGARLRSRR